MDLVFHPAEPPTGNWRFAMARYWYDYVSRQSIETDGINDAWLVETQSLGRIGSNVEDDSPFLVANEWIAGNLAFYLRLPIPPFSLMRHAGNKGMFVSLHINPKKDTPPDDADPVQWSKTDPKTCTGVILFDILIANFDRREGNILFDKPTSKYYIIDQERSVFGVLPEEADLKKRLGTLREHFAICGGKHTVGAVRHCLLDHLATTEFMEHWIKWIESIPDIFIRAICEEVIGVGITREQAEWGIEFLRRRKRSMKKLLTDNKEEFKSISNWNLRMGLF